MVVPEAGGWEVSDNTCEAASRGLARSLKPVFTRGEILATVNSLMGLAVGLRCRSGLLQRFLRVRHGDVIGHDDTG